MQMAEGTSMYAAPGRVCASGVYSWSTAACCLERYWCLYVDTSCLAPLPTLPGCRAASDAWRHSQARAAPSGIHSQSAPPCSCPFPTQQLRLWARDHRSDGVGVHVGIVPSCGSGTASYVVWSCSPW
ncbi:hypothetical protein GWK47_054331 [Chionoecetes opilio]|uniref:Uncharacterized protein n=1 Tax=Chionoecetes opilio TaxID=41210 RepID=A0A8J4Y730_CHIOP|nr:hypothetical protein GWK47_054331 [Chionoecetes opilio]